MGYVMGNVGKSMLGRFARFQSGRARVELRVALEVRA